MPYMRIDVDVLIGDVWDECLESEKAELRDLVMDEFNIPHLGLELPLDESVIEYLLEHKDFGYDTMSATAKEYVKQTIEAMLHNIQTRKFSK